MGLFHLRTGPVKIRWQGLLQPLLDAIKLFRKRKINLFASRKNLYIISPLISLGFARFIFTLIPRIYHSLFNNYSFLIILTLRSIIIFPLLLSGWASNSKYSLIGRLRGIAQSISYEAIFSSLMIFIIIIYISYSIIQISFKISFLLFYISPIWVICILAEGHRAPFDFREAESELVSGFNTEYSGANFAFIFLREYIILILHCFLISIIFIGNLRIFYNTFFILILLFFFTWIRITFCRLRYDKLIYLAWKELLPSILFWFLLFLCILIL